MLNPEEWRESTTIVVVFLTDKTCEKSSCFLESLQSDMDTENG